MIDLTSILNLGVKLAERWKLSPYKLAFIWLNKTLFGHVMSESKIMSDCLIGLSTMSDCPPGCRVNFNIFYLCVSLFVIFVLFRVNTPLSFYRNVDITHNVSSSPPCLCFFNSHHDKCTSFLITQLPKNNRKFIP